MSTPDASRRFPVRFSALVLLPAAGLAGLLLWLVMVLHNVRKENAQLHQELSGERVFHRSAAAWQSRTSDSMERMRRLEESLETMQRPQPKVESPDAARAAELERVVGFLREEIKAAQETIARLKEPSPARGRKALR